MWKFSRKNTLENFGNFPEKYEIFRTIFPPHNTSKQCAVFVLLCELVALLKITVATCPEKLEMSGDFDAVVDGNVARTFYC